MSKVVLLDAGHGKNTPGKRSPDESLMEWKYNREIASNVYNELISKGIDCRLVVTEDFDVSLKDRVQRVNNICKEVGAKNVILISIHVNAYNGQWNNANGWEVYSTRGKTNSDALAECLFQAAKSILEPQGFKMRTDNTDGDNDKEANFYIIKHALCPAILTENLFMDNKKEMEYLLSDVGRDSITKLHVKGIIDYIG